METKIKAYSYIRFSTPTQLKGDSLRRQLESSRKYATDRGWVLDESMQDLGLSAYHGIHKIKGALGRFLKLVENGKIERGSVLIVENLDRLSRQEVLAALNQFTSIIESNITIVTLQDGMEYSKESITDNWAQLIISITYMARAYDESKRKSQRISSSWISKRRKAIEGERKLTGKCPIWLKLLSDKKSFEIVKPAQEAIEIIFDLKLAGKGSEAIAKELNQSNLWKPNGRKNKLPSWRKSYINKILHNNRALLGEYQPCKLINGKRIKEGEIFLDYFPAIISVEKFNRVQAVINQNAIGFSGGRNDKMSNLFGGLAVCSECGYPMQFINKGYSSKGGQYLKCDKQIRKIEGGCVPKMIRYDIVEEHILMYCKGLNVADVIPNNNAVNSELSILREQLQSVIGDLANVKQQVGKTIDLILSASNKTLEAGYKTAASALTIKQEKLELEEKNIRININNLENATNNTMENLNSILELIDSMKKMEGQARVDLRLKLRAHLRTLITQITIDVEENIIRLIFPSRQSRRIHIYPEDPSLKIVDRTKPPILRNI